MTDALALKVYVPLVLWCMFPAIHVYHSERVEFLVGEDNPVRQLINLKWEKVGGIARMAGDKTISLRIANILVALALVEEGLGPGKHGDLDNFLRLRFSRSARSLPTAQVVDGRRRPGALPVA